MIFPRSAGISAPFLAAVLASPVASAAPERLQCLLTDTDAQSAVEQRPLVILFDEDANTMQVQESGRTSTLADVSITMTSMSGAGANMTIGVSRSSWRIVRQTYQKNSVRTEFGVCSLTVPPPPAKPISR